MITVTDVGGRARRRRWNVGIAAVSISCAACASAPSQGLTATQTVTPGESCGAYPLFNISATNTLNPRAPTPERALRTSLVSAYILGHVTPVKAGYPSRGWQLVKADSSTATFQAGKSELTFTSGNGGWTLTGGRDC
jgi:hypothetical protein